MTRATMRDVAARAGVSVFTVSSVVNNRPSVAPTTRQAVLEAMRELDYEPNHAARALNHAQAMSVAFVPSYSDNLADLSMGLLLRGMTERLTAANYTLVIQPMDEDLTALGTALKQRRIDGAIVGARPMHPVVERVRGWAQPLVLLDQPQAPGVLTVWAHYRAGIRAVVAHLVERGRRHLAFIGGPPEREMPVWHNTERLHGFAEGWTEHRLSGGPYIVHTDYSVEGGRRAMRQVLDARDHGRADVDAVVCASDRLALGALFELHAQGRRVPDELAVTGFDNFEFARSTFPPLTTVHFPVNEMGYHAADLVLQHIRGEPEPSRQVAVPVELIVRSSS